MLIYGNTLIFLSKNEWVEWVRGGGGWEVNTQPSLHPMLLSALRSLTLGSHPPPLICGD